MEDRTTEEKRTPLAGAVAQELGLDPSAVAGALALIAEGATIPFIARYRKERTRGLDEVQLRALADCAERREALETWRPWRTSTCPIARAGKPGPTRPVRRGWSP